ncbi:hydroxyacylglutathione hydrolase [Pseudoxanthomonas dokdonensis]|uniref:Hydroxyacylglutathione hydrolase n=1 Tax=Pseudoxanthomonas dokdonensis TaxID=344882 RepID=A0A0R0CQD3_9GAMM|nr:hydroxyacylglutathione hydrolase [Pseudoxanthomonas dokdonensis]KRG68078.1 hydroxyacylglutathione hydrolase [Pseudoxanthomonas dokdonensis]
MPLHAIPAFEDNYIWALADEEGDAIIVDPGDAAPVLAAAGDGLRPLAVFITHHHPDHAGGLPALRERWPGLPVYAPSDERISGPCQWVGEADLIQLKGWQFKVLEVPGHTRSHIAMVQQDPAPVRHLFTGDTLFSLGCGRMFEGTASQMLQSLDRLAALPADLRVCCGHEYTLANAAFALTVDAGNQALRERTEEAKIMRRNGQPTLPTPLSLERQTNPFLRIDDPAIRASLQQRLGAEPGDRVQAFAELRRWKDGFRA